MNTSQQTALAPFGFEFVVGTAALGCPGERSSPILQMRVSRTEPAAQDCSAGLDAEQGFFDL